MKNIFRDRTCFLRLRSKFTTLVVQVVAFTRNAEFAVTFCSFTRAWNLNPFLAVPSPPTRLKLVRVHARAREQIMIVFLWRIEKRVFRCSGWISVGRNREKAKRRKQERTKRKRMENLVPSEEGERVKESERIQKWSKGTHISCLPMVHVLHTLQVVWVDDGWKSVRANLICSLFVRSIRRQATGSRQVNPVSRGFRFTLGRCTTTTITDHQIHRKMFPNCSTILFCAIENRLKNHVFSSFSS